MKQTFMTSSLHPGEDWKPRAITSGKYVWVDMGPVTVFFNNPGEVEALIRALGDAQWMFQTPAQEGLELDQPQQVVTKQEEDDDCHFLNR